MPSQFRHAIGGETMTIIIRTSPDVMVLVPCGTTQIGQSLAAVEHYAARGQQVIVVGITRYAHRRQRCWQVCLARHGDPLRWVSGHQHKRDAEAQIERVCLAASQGDLSDDTSFAALVERLAARGDQHLKHTLGAAPDLRIDAAVV